MEEMDEREVLLVMTICELLDKSASVEGVQRAYRKSVKKLENWQEKKFQSRSTHPGQR